MNSLSKTQLELQIKQLRAEIKGLNDKINREIKDIWSILGQK